MTDEKGPGAMVEKMVVQIEEQTGKKFEWWVKLSRKDGPDRQMACVQWLKETHGFKHNLALVIGAEAAGNSMRQAYANPDELLDKMYAGKKQHLRPKYDEVARELMALGADVSDRVCKTYVSYSRKHQFALIQPTTQISIDIGLILPADTEEDDVIASVRNLGGGERFNFRIRLNDTQQLDDRARKWLKAAYNSAKPG